MSITQAIVERLDRWLNGRAWKRYWRDVRKQVKP